MAKFKASDATLSSVPLPRSEDEFLGAAPSLFTAASPVATGVAAVPSAAETSAAPRLKRSTNTTAKQEAVSVIDDDMVSFTVRIPRHHHDLLEAIAREEERSVAQVTRRLLVPAIESRARK
jgi:hypothetical protein